MEETMNSEEEFLLKWNNHQSNLIGVFKEWLRDESFVDVTLVCGGEAVSGHKVVLAACSPLLNRILHDNPCRHPVVILNDVCSTDMKALLKFIYQGEVSVSQSALASFLRTADNLQIKGLAEGKDRDDRKRKEKDDFSGIKKRQKVDFRICTSPLPLKTTQDLVSSSPKSRKRSSSSVEKSSTTNNQSTTVAVPFVNAVDSQNAQIIIDSAAFEMDGEHSSERQPLKHEDLVVKTEPLDYTGEMVWQEGNAIIKREKDNSNQDHCLASYVPNAGTSNNTSTTQQTHSNLPFGILPASLEGLSSTSAPDLIQKNIETGDESRHDDDEGKGVSATLGPEDLNQSNLITVKNSYCNSGKERENHSGNTHLMKHSELMEGENSPRRFEVSSHNSSSSFSMFGSSSDMSYNSESLAGCSVPFFYNPSTSNLNGTLYSCSSCRFQSRNPYTFNRHLRIHLGTKEFKCTVCNYASTRKDSLIRHFRVRHFIADMTHLQGTNTRQNEETLNKYT